MLRPLLSELAKITTQPRLRILCCLLLEQEGAAAHQNGQEEKGWNLLCSAAAGHLPSSTTQAGTLVKWRPQLGEMCRWHRGHLLMAAAHATLPLKCCPTYFCQPYVRTDVRTTLSFLCCFFKTMIMLKGIFSQAYHQLPIMDRT